MKNFTYRLAIADQTILGKIIKGSDSENTDFLFVGGKVVQVLSKNPEHQRTIFKIPAYELPEICHDGSRLSLNVGDIILFESSGICTLVYEIHSFSNAFFLTERCNSQCIMCAQPPKACHDKTDQDMAILELIDDSCQCIGITGGEPTMAWEGLLSLLKRCREILPKTQIQLLSNARLLKNSDYARSLADAGNPNLSLCVPIYSDIGSIHDNIVGVKGAFWETVEGIYNLQRQRVPVEIRTVVLKQNYRRLPQWSHFIYRFFPFAKHIAIMGIEPVGLAWSNLDKIWIDPMDYSKYLVDAIKIFNRGDLYVSIYNHQLCTIPKNIWRFSRKSISEWKNIFFNECELCVKKPFCGGFFMSANYRRSRGVNTII